MNYSSGMLNRSNWGQQVLIKLVSKQAYFLTYQSKPGMDRFF